MPIRPENRNRYPRDWPQISARIRERAGDRCECEGECGRGTHAGRCPNRQGKPAYGTGSKVVLTTAHLDHTPEHCDDDNLRSMCQGCHLHYDRHHHAETAYRTRREGRALSDLFVNRSRHPRQRAIRFLTSHKSKLFFAVKGEDPRLIGNNDRYIKEADGIRLDEKHSIVRAWVAGVDTYRIPLVDGERACPPSLSHELGFQRAITRIWVRIRNAITENLADADQWKHVLEGKQARISDYKCNWTAT